MAAGTLTVGFLKGIPEGSGGMTEQPVVFEDLHAGAREELTAAVPRSLDAIVLDPGGLLAEGLATAEQTGVIAFIVRSSASRRLTELVRVKGTTRATDSVTKL